MAKVLESAVPQHAADFFVVAFNPQVRYTAALPLFPHMIGKKHHVRQVCRHYGLDAASDVMLFDDDIINVSLTEGCVALKVDPKTGFSIAAVKGELMRHVS